MLDAAKNKGCPFFYLGNVNVKWFGFDLSDLRSMQFEGHELERFGLKKGDVLICEGGEAGRAAIWDEQLPNIKFQKAIHRVRPGPELLNRFLVHRLLMDSHSGRLAEYYTGATIKHLTSKDLGRYSFGLPPIDEQNKIVSILDCVESVRAKRRLTLSKLGGLTQAIFVHMFGDPEINPKGLPMAKLKDLGRLERGVSKHRPRNAPELMGGPYPLVQTGDVSRCGGYLRTFTTTYSDAGLRQSKIWPAGTLCITIAANIAKTGVLMFDACFPDSVVGFSSDRSATVEYVRVWLSFLQKKLEESAPSSAQKNINLAVLRDLDIPIPSPTDLEIFLRRITSLEKLKASHSEHLARLDNLFASLQHRAFRGEL